MAYPMSSSPISPVNLPQPYDISAAVHQALKLEMPPREITVHINTGQEQQVHDSVSPDDIDELIPNVIDTSDFIDDVWDNVTLPEEIADTDAWGENNSTNMDELERFCRYIDGDTTEEESEDSYSCSSHKLRKVDKRKRFSLSMMTESSHHDHATGGVAALQYLQVELSNIELWEEFNNIGTEMVITKNGRRMFPSLNTQVYGLNPDAVYSIYLDILPADDRRYKFMQTEWVPIGRIDKKFNFKEYMHPDSPNTGQYWMEKPILFKYLKLTNNKTTYHKDQIILNSMQKYQPSLRIKYHSQMGSGPDSRTFPFPESSFIAVTAYQNNKITQLKIDNNPYARAFRDSTTSSENNEREPKKNTKRQIRSASTTPSPPFRNQTAISHLVKSEGSATSMESGFESSSSSASEITNSSRFQLIGQYHNHHHTPQIPNTVENPFVYPFNYWTDENSLYNSVLIYPPPLLDVPSSFSEPYIHQSPQVLIDAQIPNISPIKLQPPQHYHNHSSSSLTLKFHDAIDYDDDVFS